MRNSLAIALLVIAFASIVGVAKGEDVVQVHGRLEIQGDFSRRSLTLSAIKGKHDVQYISLDRDNKDAKDVEFDFAVRAKQGAPIQLFSWNETAFKTDQRSFLFGYTTFMLGRESPVLKVRPVPIRDASMLIRDQNGNFLPDLAVKGTASVPLGGEADAPVWKQQLGLRTDAAGEVRIRYVDIQSTYHFEIGHYESKGIRYTGELSLTQRDLAATKGPIVFDVQRELPSITVQVAWDESFSAEKFVPDLTDIFANILRFESDQQSQASMNSEGEAHFFEVQPGEYSLEFLLGERGKYRITSGTEKVHLPKNLNKTLLHKLTIVPRKDTKVRGRVLEKSTGIPLKRAIVTSSLETVTTAENGEFEIKVSDDPDSPITVGKPDYRPGVILLKDFIAKTDRTLKLERPPVFSGQVVIPNRAVLEKELNSPLRGELFLRSKTRSVPVRCDAQGKFNQHVFPDNYRLLVRLVIRPDERSKDRSNLLSALVYEEEIEVPEGGRSRDFDIKPLAVVRLQANLTDEAKKSPLLGFALRRSSDKQLVASVQAKRDPTALLVVPAGRYDVVAICGHREGAKGPAIALDAGDTKSIEFDVPDWHKIQMSNNSFWFEGEEAPKLPESPRP